MDELLNLFIAYVGDDYSEDLDDLLNGMLSASLEEVRNTAFPFGFEDEDEKKLQEKLVLIQYSTVVLRIAEYHFDKIGKSGLLGTTENGTYNYYENAGTPKSYLRTVLPTAMFV